VRRGDTLGHIARRWGSGVKAIQRANGMRGTFLRVGRTLVVPLRGPCTRCPLPPEVAVPPRRLPPPEREASATNLSGPV
jgi:LysM repeat protein